MDLKPLTHSHSLDLTPKEAIAVQKHIAGKVIRKSGIDIGEVATVAGVDTHYHQDLAIAAAVVIRLSDLATVDHATAVRKIRFPYISGLLTFREDPHIEKGNYTYLKDGDETIGAVLRTRSKVKPLFVSIGHRVSLTDSINIVLQCCPRYRLPETTRRADRLARSRLKG